MKRMSLIKWVIEHQLTNLRIEIFFNFELDWLKNNNYSMLIRGMYLKKNFRAFICAHFPLSYEKQH